VGGVMICRPRTT